ncbi:MAG TPA: DUF448 domain-containing protein [Desulfocapsa sulfexigens]|nr:DUF448 domain-containing protein [Desulfocapsa sulfexigens]
MSKNKGVQPIRTCIICRKHIEKYLLLRYVWESEIGNIVLDESQTRPGRGAYCCDEEICRQRFLIRKQGWKRAFRLN